MMNQQQPDKFFREKLQNYQRTAPATAWERVESTLEKKTDYKFVWWKIAASFILLAGVTYVVWFHDSSSQAVVTQNGDMTESLPKESSVEELGNIAELEDEVAKTESTPAVVPQETSKKSEAISRKTQRNPLPVIPEKKIVGDDEIKDVKSLENVTPPVASYNPSVVKPSRIKITITSEETNKYLDENALAEATLDDKKPSTLKKLLKKANDLKSNQDPFGDLREKKNEILALNFKNEKRGENK
jgi:hypothetical protein